MYVLDTDICIELIRGNPKITETLVGLPDDTRLYITAITAAELYFGAFSSNRPDERSREVENLLADFEILSLDQQAAKEYGIRKAELKSAGQLVSDTDLFIASIVVSHRLTLITHNIKHFQRIDGLDLEDWLKP